MFSFNFQVNNDENSFNVEDSVNQQSDVLNNSEKLHWYSSKELSLNHNILDRIDSCRLKIIDKPLKNCNISHVESGFALRHLYHNEKNECELTCDCSAHSNLKKIEDNHNDLIPGIYEGGAKIWECTDDLLNYLDDHYSVDFWLNKRVLDLGCGAGLLGIYVYKHGGSVDFQDYNEDVLKGVTMPNLLLNVSKSDSTECNSTYIQIYNVNFFSGDWRNWLSMFPEDQVYDVILTSETIYNPGNQRKLLDCLYKKIKLNGVILLAAKIYYFGVGGDLRQFEELIKKEQIFSTKTVWSSEDGVKRQILELKRKNHKTNY